MNKLGIYTFRELTMGNQSSPFVSVIVPVFNNSEGLKKCLEALEHQTYPNTLYEVIVVDNGSDEDIKEVVSQFSQAFAAYESQPGSYCARNKGLSLAKGNVLAFTDSDCIPALDWIEKGVDHLLQAPNGGLVAGKIKLFFKNPVQPTAIEYYDSIMMGFPQHKYIEESRYGATANLFTFRSIIDKVGPFDQTLKSSGDREWGQRVFSAGYEQIYADDVCVAHPARHSLEQLHKKVVRKIGGHQDLKKKKGYKFSRFIGDIAVDLLPPFRLYLRVWLDKNIKGYKQKLQFNFVFLYIKYLQAWERVRTQLGGTSTRG